MKTCTELSFLKKYIHIYDIDATWKIFIQLSSRTLVKKEIMIHGIVGYEN